MFSMFKLSTSLLRCFPIELEMQDILLFGTSDIPYFKQVVIMATVCDACGHRDNEVKGGTGIEPKGKKITLLVSKKEDLNRDVLKVQFHPIAVYSLPSIL